MQPLTDVYYRKARQSSPRMYLVSTIKTSVDFTDVDSRQYLRKRLVKNFDKHLSTELHVINQSLLEFKSSKKTPVKQASLLSLLFGLTFNCIKVRFVRRRTNLAVSFSLHYWRIILLTSIIAALVFLISPRSAQYIGEWIGLSGTSQIISNLVGTTLIASCAFTLMTIFSTVALIYVRFVVLRSVNKTYRYLRVRQIKQARKQSS